MGPVPGDLADGVVLAPGDGAEDVAETNHGVVDEGLEVLLGHAGKIIGKLDSDATVGLV